MSWVGQTGKGEARMRITKEHRKLWRVVVCSYLDCDVGVLFMWMNGLGSFYNHFKTTLLLLSC